MLRLQALSSIGFYVNRAALAAELYLVQVGVQSLGLLPRLPRHVVAGGRAYAACRP